MTISGFPELLDVVAQIPLLCEAFDVDLVTDAVYARNCSVDMYVKLYENVSLLPYLPWTSAKLLKNVKYLGAKTNGGKSEKSERVLAATLAARKRLLDLPKSSNVKEDVVDGFGDDVVESATASKRKKVKM
jgi:hypothetical protein